jgi:hypothetical protein
MLRARAGARVTGCPRGPRLGDQTVAHAVDVDLVDALEASSGGRVASPGTEFGGRAAEASGDLLALGDQLDDLHADVGEAFEERRDPAARRRAMLLSDVELVEIAGLASIAAPTAECKAHGAE